MDSTSTCLYIIHQLITNTERYEHLLERSAFIIFHVYELSVSNRIEGMRILYLCATNWKPESLSISADLNSAYSHQQTRTDTYTPIQSTASGVKTDPLRIKVSKAWT